MGGVRLQEVVAYGGSTVSVNQQFSLTKQLPGNHCSSCDINRIFSKIFSIISSAYLLNTSRNKYVIIIIIITIALRFKKPSERLVNFPSSLAIIPLPLLYTTVAFTSQGVETEKRLTDNL